MDWKTVYKKYDIEVHDDGSITWNKKEYPKHVVNAVEKITFQNFPVVDENNVDVLIAHQLSILKYVIV